MLKYDCKIPKTVQEARRKLLESGEVVSVDSITKVLSKEDLNKLGSTLRTALNKEGGEASNGVQGLEFRQGAQGVDLLVHRGPRRGQVHGDIHTVEGP